MVKMSHENGTIHGNVCQLDMTISVSGGDDYVFSGLRMKTLTGFQTNGKKGHYL